MRKILLTTLAALLVLVAAPLSAQLAGTWSGTGSGSCDYSGITLYPWQNWTGVIPASEDAFTGTWWDASGNIGTFFHTNIIPLSSDIVIIEGRWTLILPSGIETVGSFRMTFYTHNRVCSGEWDAGYPTVPPRIMYGRAI